MSASTLPRSFTLAASRRGLLAGLTGGVFAVGALGMDHDAEARKHGKNRKRKGRKNKKQNRPRTRTDATCGGGSDANLGAFSGNNRLAQTFTAIRSGPLVSAQILILKLAGDTAGDFVLRLSPVAKSGEVNAPANEVLAETSFTDAALPVGESTVTFTFATPFTVVAGTEYALVLTRPGGGQFAWSGHGDSCSGQAFVGLDQTGAFIDTGIDLIFTTFVRS